MPAQSSPQNFKRQIPSVDRVLNVSTDLIAQWGRQAVTAAIRSHLNTLRQAKDLTPDTDLATETIQNAVAQALATENTSGLLTVINLSGVVLHTNLGRACLPAQASQAAERAARLPNNLEYDLNTGKRGNRDHHIESLICALTGAEAATVVNNNAAAVVLSLNTLAKEKEVPLSRGELVEIGGSFRMPDVMAASGCTLVEVGATNRTHLKDYQQAINDQTALLMKVHTSNYRVEGFTQAVDEQTLCELAHQRGIPCIVDLGSGCLVDMAEYGLPAEPKAADYFAKGVDLLTFSGDKLLGGPQCGIIAGRSELVARINKNPLKRAMRVDSMILAALAEVLKLYRHPETLTETLPTLRHLTRATEKIKAQAEELCPKVANCLPESYQVTIEPCYSQIGSGALPVETLASFALVISSKAEQDSEIRQLARALRQLPHPIIGRIHDKKLLLDLRCLDDEPLFLQQMSLLKPAFAASPPC